MAGRGRRRRCPWPACTEIRRERKGRWWQVLIRSGKFQLESWKFQLSHQASSTQRRMLRAGSSGRHRSPWLRCGLTRASHLLDRGVEAFHSTQQSARLRRTESARRASLVTQRSFLLRQAAVRFSARCATPFAYVLPHASARHHSSSAPPMPMGPPARCWGLCAWCWCTG